MTRNELETTIYEKLKKMSCEELEKLNDILDVLEIEIASQSVRLDKIRK